jgi:dynein light intermediate chain 1
MRRRNSGLVSRGEEPFLLSTSVSLSFLRTIPSNIFLVRGQSSTGKSTLASALLQKPLANAEKDVPCTDFVGGCDWADGRDEEEEGLPSI